MFNKEWLTYLLRLDIARHLTQDNSFNHSNFDFSFVTLVKVGRYMHRLEVEITSLKKKSTRPLLLRKILIRYHEVRYKKCVKRSTLHKKTGCGEATSLFVLGFIGMRK